MIGIDWVLSIANVLWQPNNWYPEQPVSLPGKYFKSPIYTDTIQTQSTYVSHLPLVQGMLSFLVCLYTNSQHHQQQPSAKRAVSSD